MASAAQNPTLDALLAPIPGASTPAGNRLADDDQAEIERARHSDDGGAGVWQRERVDPNWYRLRDLTRDALSTKSKHLNLAIWYTEAQVHLEQLPGMIEGLDLLRGLIEQFWDQGLLPAMEDGDATFRARSIESLGGKLLPLLRQIPLTRRSDAGDDYCLLNFFQARKAGREKDLRDANGNIDARRQADRKEVVDSGGITGELWEAAVKTSRRAFYEELSADLDRAWNSLLALVRTMDEERFFGPNEAPSFAGIRELLENLRSVIVPILNEKRQEEPDPSVKSAGPGPEEKKPVLVEKSRVRSEAGDGAEGPWAHAQFLVRSGQIEQALEEMTRLGAQETARNRFLHRLELAEICAETNRTSLAIVILEDLDEQIKNLNLAAWESPELIGRVWGLLYHQYRKAGDKQALAEPLYLRLCRLDPWQGLKWV